jgi:hypothetical protein
MSCCSFENENIYNFRGAKFQNSANFAPLWPSDNALGQVQKFLIQCFLHVQGLNIGSQLAIE